MTLPFDRMGPAAAHPILFLHGAAVTRKMWLPQLQGLADEYRVLAADLPGHGALAGHRFRLEEAVDEIADVIKKEAHGQALIVGSSLGGYVALAFAQKHPKRAAGLVLSGCSISFTGLLGSYIKVVGFLIRYVLPEGWLQRLVARSFRRTLPPSVAEPLIDAGLYAKVMGEAFLDLAGKDVRSMVRTFPGPVLVLNGDRDKPNRRAAASFTAAAQNGQAQIISQAGHACSLEQPQAFTSAVRRFAKSIGW